MLAGWGLYNKALVRAQNRKLQKVKYKRTMQDELGSKTDEKQDTKIYDYQTRTIQHIENFDL